MRHQTLDQLHAIAEVQTDPAIVRMTRFQRLERWAELLEHRPGPVATLAGTEYYPRGERDTMHAQGSPITVAFEDRVLREQGLANDTYGAARRFFELTDRQLHLIVCECHVGALMPSTRAAHYVRTAARNHRFSGLLRRFLNLSF